MPTSNMMGMGEIPPTGMMHPMGMNGMSYVFDIH